jgi:hypothetical protein
MISLPIRTGTGPNMREHFRVRSKRVAKEREDTAWFLHGKLRPALPCTVHLIRSAPSRGLDDDNLRGSLKSIRDAIAHWLGVDDRHQQIVAYTYDQISGPWGVLVDFRPPSSGAQLVLGQNMAPRIAADAPAMQTIGGTKEVSP